MLALSLQSWAMVGVIAVAGTVTAASRWQVAQAEGKLAECASDLRETRAALDKSNARADTWAAAASSAAKTSQEALQTAQAVTAGNAAELKRLRAAKPVTCDEAVRQVREGLR